MLATSLKGLVRRVFNKFKRQIGLINPPLKGVCPLCKGTAFKVPANRDTATCMTCNARARRRLMALAFKRLLPGTVPGLVVHCAPEKGIVKILHGKYGQQYRPVDFMPETYQHLTRVPVEYFDMTKPFETFEPGSVGLLVHSHVLEHLFVPIPGVIADLNKLLAPGGLHVVQVPVGKGLFREDMDISLTEAQRLERFGQEDHVRMFGEDDFEERFLSLFAGMERVPVEKFVTKKDMVEALVPADVFDCPTSHTLYVFRKPLV